MHHVKNTSIITKSLSKIPTNGSAKSIRNGDHSKQHSYKTIRQHIIKNLSFWDHPKQHSSKTRITKISPLHLFWDHSKQHSSKTPQPPAKSVLFICFGTIQNSIALKHHNRQQN
ncbi:hypothetical protein ACOD5K_08265, partial [Streptococcus pyogenes]